MLAQPRLDTAGNFSSMFGTRHVEQFSSRPLLLSSPVSCKVGSPSLVHSPIAEVVLPVHASPPGTLKFSSLPTHGRSPSSSSSQDGVLKRPASVTLTNAPLPGCCTSLAPLLHAKRRRLTGKQTSIDSETTTMQSLVGAVEPPCDSAEPSDQKLQVDVNGDCRIVCAEPSSQLFNPQGCSTTFAFCGEVCCGVELFRRFHTKP